MEGNRIAFISFVYRLLVLGKVLKEDVYKHFLPFVTAMRCLCDPKLCRSHCDYAQQLLVYFVQRAEEIYGEDFYVYNIHSLIHIPDDVRKYGNLDTISSFPFENLLGKLKSYVRKGQLPLQQVIKRLGERKNLGSTIVPQTNMFLHQHWNGPLPRQIIDDSTVKQFDTFKTSAFLLKLSSPNNCLSL